MKTLTLGILCAGLLAGCAARPAPFAQPQAPAFSPAAIAAASTFAQQSQSLDQLVIQSSQMALQRSQNPAVRALAQNLANAHTQLSSQLGSTAQSLSVPINLMGMQGQHSALLLQLQYSTAADFDRSFQNVVVTGLMQGIDLDQHYSASGEIQELRNFAAGTVPVLQSELAQAQSLPAKTPTYRRPNIRHSGERG